MPTSQNYEDGKRLGRDGQPETRADRERRVKRMIERHPDWANARVAKHCGVSDMAVKKYRDDLESISRITRCETRVRSNGNPYPATPAGRDRWQIEALEPIGGKPRHPYVRRLAELDADIRRQLGGAKAEDR